MNPCVPISVLIELISTLHPTILHLVCTLYIVHTIEQYIHPPPYHTSLGMYIVHSTYYWTIYPPSTLPYFTWYVHCTQYILLNNISTLHPTILHLVCTLYTVHTIGNVQFGFQSCRIKCKIKCSDDFYFYLQIKPPPPFSDRIRFLKSLKTLKELSFCLKFKFSNLLIFVTCHISNLNYLIQEKS